MRNKGDVQELSEENKGVAIQLVSKQSQQEEAKPQKGGGGNVAEGKKTKQKRKRGDEQKNR